MKKLGGLNNHNYQVGPFVIRLTTHGLHEKKFLQRLIPYHLTPKTYLMTSKCIISQYIPNASVSQNLMTESTFLQELATTLKQLHLLECDMRFDIFEQIEHQLQALKSINFPLPKHLNILLNHLYTLKPKLEKSFTLGLCHNDLNVSNVLYTDRIWLIDFEFCGMNDVFYDLATFCWLLPDEARLVFLSSYFGKVTPDILEKLEDYLFVVKLWNMLWSYEKSTSTHSDYDYKAGGDFVYTDLLSKFM